MNDDRRKRLLVIALGLVLVLFLLFRVAPLIRPSAGPDGSGFGPGAGIGEAQVAALRVDRLDAEARDYSPGRNPFRYYTPPVPPPPPPPRVVQEPVFTPPPPPPDRGPRLPPIDYVFLGSFGPKARPIAVLVNGDEIHNVREGEVLGDQFLVGNIGYESVDLEYLEFPDQPPARLAAGG